ncbi:MAG: HAD-IIIC family phosphatase [Helicobacteraceae bacterium]|jgi:FkbH-like protein|nr:HAD-IIIC family phosphatase [Helicobacteraceae bacterium]
MISPLFAKELKRLDILSLPKNKSARSVTITVHRNHSFETIASVLNAFLNFAELEAEFIYSAYDDSLNFTPEQKGDLHLIYIDLLRYKTDDITGFIADRAAALRSKTKAPILIVYLEKNNAIDLKTDISDCFAFSLKPILDDLGLAAYDLAKEPYSGTRLSNKASLEIARYLGLKLIPALLLTPLKAIVCDLDNTLYQGVLGEDGIENLKPNLALQQAIKELKQSGFFLAIASKNEEIDAKLAFEKRSDFILKFDDFAATQINWNSKRDNIIKIAKTLNIGADAMLFIDDNPAEIQNVEGTGVKTILASSEESALAQLRFYPRLTKLKILAEDSLRDKDARSNIEREKLAKTLSQKEYFEKLGVKLRFSVDNYNQCARIAELFGKTNQFILTYKRYNQSEIKELMLSSDSRVITIAMSDNLSDSGIIAIMAAHKQGALLELDDMVVSCRALGRNIENIALPFMFDLAAKGLKTDNKIIINYKKGERNAPAFAYLAALTDQPLESQGRFVYDIPERIDTSGLEITIE